MKQRDTSYSGDIDELIEIMAQLRHPETGCPWDLKQDFQSISPYTIEEAYEVADAIERKDMLDLKQELGDLLLQVVFHAQMAREQHVFDFADVVSSICEKMVTRHPHVFENQIPLSDEELHDAWEARKEDERVRKQIAIDSSNKPASALAGIANNLPALVRSQKLIRRAMRAGFRWNTIERVFEKCQEELSELKQAHDETNSRAEQEEELGDLFFVSVCAAEYLGLNAEVALAKANKKFEQRYVQLEQVLAERDIDMEQASEKELLDIWSGIKDSGLRGV